MEENECQTTVIHKTLVKQVKSKMLGDEVIMEMADFFKIFGDGTRLRIINCLIRARMCVCDIANVLNMSHSSISHQLRFLKDHNIVRYTKDGKVVYYELSDKHILEIFSKGYDHLNE